MGFVEIGALILTGAGTLGSVLGLFYTFASKENGKLTRAMMKESDEKTRTLILNSDEKTRALIAEMHDKTEAGIRVMHEDYKAMHEDNKALLTSIVELLKKNGSGR